MGLASMTGFATADGWANGIGWQWDVRCVNGKGLDIRCRLPQGLERLEPDIRTRVQRHVRRGNCQVNLVLERSAGAPNIVVNEAVLERVLDIIERLNKKVNAAPLAIEGLLALRGVLEVVEDKPHEAVVEERERLIMESLDTALKDLDRARRAEGGRLQAVLAEQLNSIKTLTEAARDCPARAPAAIRAHIDEQIRRLLESSAALDSDRLHQEAVLIAARADIQEEIDRLFSHVEQGLELIHSDGPVGRRLDFLTQEFNREANTLCSKANAAELTQIGLEMKAIVDQIREQVQNVE